MRLTTEQIRGITDSCQDFLVGTKANLYLYGSRVDDQKRGGDIDLLLIVEDLESKIRLLIEKHLLLSKIKSRIGDQKIDLKIALESELETDPFLRLAAEGSKKVLLRLFLPKSNLLFEQPFD